MTSRAFTRPRGGARRALIAQPCALPTSPFAELMASIGAREVRSVYSSPPPNCAGMFFLVTPSSSIGRKRRSRRARGRRH